MTSSSAAPTGADRARFAGEWQQHPGAAGGELVHLRARDYDPTVSVFLSRDPLATVTLDPYSYAAGNPLVMVDPDGMVGFPASLALGTSSPGSETPSVGHSATGPKRSAVGSPAAVRSRRRRTLRTR